MTRSWPSPRRKRALPSCAPGTANRWLAFDKSPTDFATLADIEAEKVNVLRTAHPGDALLGEESGYHGPHRADRTWLVDPLCGTLNDAARTALVAVNVVLRTGKDIQVAASADPLRRAVLDRQTTKPTQAWSRSSTSSSSQRAVHSRCRARRVLTVGELVRPAVGGPARSDRRREDREQLPNTTMAA